MADSKLSRQQTVVVGRRRIALKGFTPLEREIVLHCMEQQKIAAKRDRSKAQ